MGIYREANRDWSSRLFTIIVIVALGVGFYFLYPLLHAKKADDCAYFKEQNQQLVNALLDIKSNIKSLAEPTSFTGTLDAIMWATYTDTTRKPMKASQYQEALRKIDQKIDSILLKNRLDSLRNTQKKGQ